MAIKLLKYIHFTVEIVGCVLNVLPVTFMKYEYRAIIFKSFNIALLHVVIYH